MSACEDAYRAWYAAPWSIAGEESAFRAGWDAALAAAEEKCGEIARANYERRNTPLGPEGDAMGEGAEECERALSSLRAGAAGETGEAKP